MNKIIILVIFLIIFILIYVNFSKYFEFFSSNNYFSLIGKNEAKEVLLKVDTFSKYNMLDKKLRNISKNTNLANYYIEALLDWNNSEEKLLNWLLTGLIKKTPKRYLFLYKNVTIAKYKDNIEVGFPHTNKNTIFLTSKFVNLILPFFNNENIDMAILEIGSVIVHECVHIYQRRDPSFFNELYVKLGFKKNKKIINLKRYANKNRYNPDGLDLNWTYFDNDTNEEYVLLSIYNENATNISHVNLVGIYLERLGKDPIIPPIPKIEFLNNINDFNNRFGNLGGNNYHPNEISAEIISRIVLQDINNENMQLNLTNNTILSYESLGKDIIKNALNL